MVESKHQRREQTLREVRQVTRAVLSRYPVKVYLFGSWATGTPSRHSDIDLGIDPAAPLPPGMFAELREQFEESRIPYRVEVVDLSAADPMFREHVICQGNPWND